MAKRVVRIKRYSEKFLKNSWVQAAFFKIKHHLFEQQLIFGKSNGCSNDLTVFTSSVDHMTSLIHCKDSKRYGQRKKIVHIT